MSIRKKMAAFVAACMMLLALPAMAFAAPSYDAVGVDGNYTNEPTVARDFNVQAQFATDALAQTATDQSLTITLGTPTSVAGLPTPSAANVLGKTTSTVAFTGVQAQKNVNYAVALTKLFAGITFNAPGVYPFNVAVVDGQNPNLDYATVNTNIAHIDVVVAKNAADPTKLAVYDVFIYDGNGKKMTQGAEGGDIIIKSNAGKPFELSKTVKGLYGNEETPFNFTVTIAGVKGNYELPETFTQTSGEQGATQVYTVSLKHGEKATINNLPKGATVTVEEAGTKAYVPTAVANGANFSAAAGEGLTSNITVDTFTSGSTDVNSIAYTNTKDKPGEGEILPTGLMMEVAPYVAIALAAIAGAILFVVARRRRRESDEF